MADAVPAYTTFFGSQPLRVTATAFGLNSLPCTRHARPTRPRRYAGLVTELFAQLWTQLRPGSAACWTRYATPDARMPAGLVQQHRRSSTPSDTGLDCQAGTACTACHTHVPDACRTACGV